jgi:hypothetical protein
MLEPHAEAPPHQDEDKAAALQRVWTTLKEAERECAAAEESLRSSQIKRDRARDQARDLVSEMHAELQVFGASKDEATPKSEKKPTSTREPKPASKKVAARSVGPTERRDKILALLKDGMQYGCGEIAKVISESYQNTYTSLKSLAEYAEIEQNDDKKWTLRKPR